jgi:transcriptional regulator with GAF, ATPase, and Fis domain
MGKTIRGITSESIRLLEGYPWPGNVRELENVIERAVIVSMGSQLELGEWLPKPSVTQTGARMPRLEELDRDHIIKALELTAWRVSGERGAAKLLGLKPTTLDARMKKLGIRKKESSTPNIS